MSTYIKVYADILERGYTPLQTILISIIIADAECSLSNRELAKECNSTEEEVKNALSFLREAGAVAATQQNGRRILKANFQEQRNSTKEYIVYTPWVATGLRERGFKILHTGINVHKPQFNTWYFEDTPALRQAIGEITHR